MATISLTRHLHSFFPHLQGDLGDIDAATVAELVAVVESRAPGFTFYICDERGKLRPHVNIFIGPNGLIALRCT